MKSKSMRFQLGVFLPSIGLLLLTANVRGATLDTFATRYYPSVLVTTPAGPVPVTQRKVALATGDLDGSRSSLVAAVFYNGMRAAVSVISPAGQGTVLATSAPDAMTGSTASISLVDFDHAGGKEIVVTMQQPRGLPTAWIFKWTGTSLDMISPLAPGSSPGDPESDLADPSFVDLDGSGRIAIIDRHAGNSTSEDGTVATHEQVRIFRMLNGKFEPDAGPADYLSVFTGQKGEATPQFGTFDVTDPSRARDIVIINGVGSNAGQDGDDRSDDDNHGTSRVSSAEVILNGQPIATAKSLNDKVAVLHVTTGVKAHDEITVKINGSPDGTLTILVLPR
jgi:hypothetical protein